MLVLMRMQLPVTSLKGGVTKYTVTFTSAIGPEFSTIEVDAGGSFIFPTPSDVTGYTFDNWLDTADGNTYEAGVIFTGLSRDMEFEAQWTETSGEISIQIDAYNAGITDTKYKDYEVADPYMNYVINAARSASDNIKLGNNDKTGLFNTSYPADYHIAKIEVEFGLNNNHEKMAIVLSNTELTMTDVYSIIPYETYEGIGDHDVVTLENIDNNYKYFGIRSNGDVMYVKSINIVWHHD